MAKEDPNPVEMYVCWDCNPDKPCILILVGEGENANPKSCPMPTKEKPATANWKRKEED